MQTQSLHNQSLRQLIQLSVMFFLLLALALPLGVKPAMAQGAINRVYITDVTDIGFTVSWTTTTASNGSVFYGTGTPNIQVNDPIASTTTHYVQITPLSPNTTYHFYVQSGALIDNNGGANYTVTTGPSLISNPRTTIFGTIFEQNGTTPVPNAIMYFRLQDNGGPGTGNSQWVTARADNAGGYFYTFGGVRTENFQTLFLYDETIDNLQLVAQGGDKGVLGEVGAEWVLSPMTNANPLLQNAVLDNVPNAVELTQFTASNTPSNTLAKWVGVGISLLALAGLVVVWNRKRA